MTLDTQVCPECGASFNSHLNWCCTRQASDKPDMVNHPPHYKSGGMEVIDVLEAFNLNFRLANSVKYILRHGAKGSPLEDLKKAQWYLNREISKLELPK